MRLHSRQSTGSDATDQFLDLIADPFQAEVQENSIYAAIVWSFAVAGSLFLLFCWLRPRNSRVYAPRAKHADQKHAPPSLGRRPFSWFHAVKDVKEQELVDKIGLDAVVFLRFIRMIRNIFVVLTVFGCGILIPVNVVGGSAFYKQWDNIATLMKFTPQYIFGPKFWAFVACSYLFQGTVCFFIWWNYRKIFNLRRSYFNSHDYQSSLHSRTLLLTHLPKTSQSDDGIAKLVEQAQQTHDIPRTAVGRNVKDLPELIKAHDVAVRQLEGHLAKYLSDPNRLPEQRPTCKAAKEDRLSTGNAKVDAIDYLTDRIAKLETEIREVRGSIDSRDTMSYGFASYTHIEDAHAVAYASRKKGPGGCDVYLAPKPHDLIWQNLPMSRATRRRRIFWDGLWMVLFTLAFIIPNILTSVFLSDFSHLGLVWPSFQNNLQAHPTGWGIAQGVLAPLVQTLMYMGIPIVFRRLYTHSGDVSKTSRERHVTSRVYAFFVFNNLFVFSVFGSGWRFVASVIAAQDQGVWEAIRSAHLFSKVMTGLLNVSTFWLTWQMQRNLGAAIDLVQAWPFVRSFILRKWFSPTPRELIELSAPQPFAYADYYNNYLFVSTVGLCFGALQPILLPVTAFYLSVDAVFKKYLLQYVFITKTESGGRFWRFLVNRLLFATMLANAIIALVVGAQGVGSINSVRNGNMLYAMVPLPILLFAFKWYCKRSFDTKLLYYSTTPFSDSEAAGTTSNGHSTTKPKRSDRVVVRFGNPALYKRLITPMVHARSQHLLKEIYAHRSSTDRNIFEAPHRRSTDRAMPSTPLAYSDIFMAELDASQQPGKPATGAGAGVRGQDIPPVEIVAEQDLDFEHFKRRAEFREQFGGDGELYGRPEDLLSRPGTPSTFRTLMSEAGMSAGKIRGTDTVASSRDQSKVELGVVGEMEGEPEQEPEREEEENVREEREDELGTLYQRGYRPAPLNDGFEEVDIEIPTTPLDVRDILAAGGRRSYIGRKPVPGRNAQREEDSVGYFDGVVKDGDRKGTF